LATAIATNQTILCSQLVTVACGGSSKDADLDGQLIKAAKREEVAARPAKG